MSLWVQALLTALFIIIGFGVLYYLYKKEII